MNMQDRLAEAMAHQSAGRLVQAIQDYQSLLAQHPDHPDVLNLLAQCYMAQGNLPAALPLVERAAAVLPDFPPILNSLAMVQMRSGQILAARDNLLQALSRTPEERGIIVNLLSCVNAIGQSEIALPLSEKAIGLWPHDPEVISARAVALRFAGEIEAGLRLIEDALPNHPAHAHLNWNRAIMLLELQRYGSGWPDLEWRYQTTSSAVVKQMGRLPRLTLGAPALPRLLVMWEQGLGDGIQFSRFLPQLRQYAPEAVMFVPGAAAELFGAQSALQPVRSTAEAARITSQAWTGVVSLPALIQSWQGTEIAISGAPYLTVPEPRRALWRTRLGPKQGKLRVGLSWSGNPKQAANFYRAIPYDMLRGLGEVAEVDFVSLQIGEAGEEAAAWAGEARLLRPFKTRQPDLIDTAAIMTELDLVISTDTMSAHLAGALGVPVWVALYKYPDWRWGREGVRTPWYDSAELFRQKEAGDWGPVLLSIKERLWALL